MSATTPNDMPTRVAILEEIARGTKAALERIERRLDSMETNHRADFRTLLNEQRADFRWILGVVAAIGAALLGIMARGFHWF